MYYQNLYKGESLNDITPLVTEKCTIINENFEHEDA